MTSTSEEPSDLFSEVHELTHSLLQGRSTEEQRRRLEELVLGDDQACRLYVQYVHESVSLHRMGRARPFSMEPGKELQPSPDLPVAGLPGEESDSALVRPPLAWAELGSRNRENAPSRFRSVRRRTRGFAGVLAIVGTAAAGAVVVAVVLLAFRNWLSPSIVLDTRHAARIVKSVDASWSRAGEPLSLTAGDWLSYGRYSLTSGIAQIVFPWGTEVTLEAPAEIELSVEGARRLIRGQLIAKVSKEDTGFTIDTPTVEVVDLGTEFGISAAANGESEVHVFKGAVEARQRYGDQSSSAVPLKLSAGQATIFGQDKNPVRQILYNPRRFFRAWRVASRVAETGGGMHFAHPPPASIIDGQTESNESLLLFLEREAARLPAPTAVTFTHPDLYTTFGERASWLPAGLEVDSYLIHFDPVGRLGNEAPVTVKGSVTFDRPILGVIVRGDQLGQTDAFLAAPDTDYVAAAEYSDPYDRGFLTNPLPPFFHRGLTGMSNPNRNLSPNLRRSMPPNDSVRLSQDRLTLTVSCTGDGQAEHIRVLVATSDDEPMPNLVDPPTGISQPFRGRPFAVGETIEAEDFDLGGPGVGYQDSTPDLMADTYRTRESVEIYSYLTDDRAAHAVGFTRPGEWMAYSVEVPEGGTYVVQARVSSRIGGGRFRFEFGDAAATESMVVPKTYSDAPAFPPDSYYVTIESSPVSLPAGKLVMRVVMEKLHEVGWVGDFDWFRIVSVPSPSEATGQ